MTPSTAYPPPNFSTASEADGALADGVCVVREAPYQGMQRAIAHQVCVREPSGHVANEIEPVTRAPPPQDLAGILRRTVDREQRPHFSAMSAQIFRHLERNDGADAIAAKHHRPLRLEIHQRIGVVLGQRFERGAESLILHIFRGRLYSVEANVRIEVFRHVRKVGARGAGERMDAIKSRPAGVSTHGTLIDGYDHLLRIALHTRKQRVVAVNRLASGGGAHGARSMQWNSRRTNPASLRVTSRLLVLVSIMLC